MGLESGKTFKECVNCSMHNVCSVVSLQKIQIWVCDYHIAPKIQQTPFKDYTHTLFSILLSTPFRDSNLFLSFECWDFRNCFHRVKIRRWKKRSWKHHNQSPRELEQGQTFSPKENQTKLHVFILMYRYVPEKRATEWSRVHIAWRFQTLRRKAL